jgi:hypothetical protein
MSELRPRLLCTLIGTLVVATAFSSCAPRQNEASTTAQVRLEIRRSNLGSTSATDSALPQELCYFINVTGDRLEKLAPSPSGCGPASGMGQVSERAYNVGDTAELSVPVGGHRLFEIVGVASPLGVQNGRALCGSFSFQVLPPSSANAEPQSEFRIEGQLVKAPPVLFYSGRGDVNPGIENVITLDAVAQILTPLTASYTFGAPYNRQDRPGSGTDPALCRPATRFMANVALMSSSGAGLSAPVPGTATDTTPSPTLGLTLRMVTVSPLVSPTPTRAIEGSFTLKTGLGEILHGE